MPTSPPNFAVCAAFLSLFARETITFLLPNSLASAMVRVRELNRETRWTSDESFAEAVGGIAVDCPSPSAAGEFDGGSRSGNLERREEMLRRRAWLGSEAVEGGREELVK